MEEFSRKADCVRSGSKEKYYIPLSLKRNTYNPNSSEGHSRQGSLNQSSSWDDFMRNHMGKFRSTEEDASLLKKKGGRHRQIRSGVEGEEHRYGEKVCIFESRGW